MITTTKEALWKVIRKYNEYKEIDEQLAADYINQWIALEDSRYRMEQDIKVLDNIEKELEKIRQKEDIVDKVNKVDTHLCSKLNYQTIDNKQQPYCMQTGKPTACLGMRMFCHVEQFEKGDYKNELKREEHSDSQIKDCEHYLQQQKYCLQRGYWVKCNEDRENC